MKLEGYFLGDGTKSMACPHCKRMLAVDIDDILPIHSRVTWGNQFFDPNWKDPIDDLCDGSWNTKGTLITLETWPKDDIDAS